MCGFVGATSQKEGPAVSAEVAIRMRDSLTHRGPDDAGIHVGPHIMLGSRRLSIVDLSEKGHMPMSTPDGRYWLAYNGEVYNFRSLREELKAKGISFQSNTDTEVVLWSLVTWGTQALERFNGMFAFALWDSQEHSLLLVRDRLGVKPLYWANHDSGIVFGSEAKALFAMGVPKEFDTSTWGELLVFRYVAGTHTPFKDVNRLLPGHLLKWKAGKSSIQRWWNLSERAQALHEDARKSDAIERFRSTFDDAVALRRISDVPLGVMLSGGLDSSTVATTLSMQAGQGINSFTVRFDEAGYDEGPIAQSVVSACGLRHHDIRVTPEELHSLIFKATHYFDEPLVHGNDSHMLALATKAKQNVTVLLSGEGADETLNGYVRYQPFRLPQLWHPARWGLPKLSQHLGESRFAKRVDKMRRFVELPSIDEFILYNASDLLPSQLSELGFQVQDDFGYRRAVLKEAQSYSHQPLRQAMYLDQHTFLVSLLDRNDRMTMGASIECRVPFLDYRLVEYLAALPTSKLCPSLSRKAVLRKAMVKRLPEAVQKAPKWGFGVPWQRYFREVPTFRDWAEGLENREPVASGPLDRVKVRQAVQEYLAGDSKNEPLIKMLFMMTVWHDVQFKSLARVAA